MGPVKAGINIMGARITQTQIFIIGASLLLAVGVAIFSKTTRMGKSMRAIANDPELASISGIKSDLVILLTFVLGSALAGVAGILVALDLDLTPSMGMNALMIGVVAVIIAGRGNVPGIVLASLFLGILQSLAVWFVGAHWQDMISFFVLLTFLLFRPQGLLGRKAIKATV